jgi:hypothetical protein
MKNCKLVLSVILLFATITSCRKVTGKGPVVTEARQTASFEGLELKIPANVYFTQDPAFKVELQAQENVLDEIETTVINNNLQIRFRRPTTRISSNDGITIYVSGPNVRSFTVDGSGYLEAPAPITLPNLGLQVNGSGNIRINNTTTTLLDAGIDGSGHITVSSGNANSANLRINGSGLLDVSGIMVKDADARISGSGNIIVFATQNLNATISGSGSIMYKGNPAVSKHITGSGTVTHQ